MVAVTDFNASAVTFLVTGGAVAVVFALVFAIRFAASFPKLPAPGPETSDLGDEPPAVANLLVNRCQVTNAAPAATLIDLAARQHLELFEAGPQRYVVRLRPDRDEPLLDYERQVLDLVRTKATGGSAPLEAIEIDTGLADSWHDRFRKQVVADARSRGLLRGRWSRLDWALFAVLAGAALVLVAAGLYAAHVEQLASTHRVGSGSSSRRFTRDNWFWVAGIAWLVILAAIASLRSIRYSPKGKAAASRWLGVRRFLRHDPSFADATPAAVAIWNRLLAYGTSLGAARAAAAAIPLGAEDIHTAWSRYGGDWHQLHVEYPRRFGYGQRPVAVFLGGLLRVIVFGGLALAALPFVIDQLWRVGSDAIDKSTLANEEVTGIVVAFFVVFGVIALGLLLRLADGLVRTWRGGADLGRTHTVDGDVVKVLGAGWWFAVDPGHVDHVKAWHPADAGLPPRGATVRVSVTRHLGHVAGITVLKPPATSPSLPTSTAPAATTGAARSGAGSAGALLAGLDSAVVSARAGRTLPETDPATLTSVAGNLPPGSLTRAFSDGTNQIVITALPQAGEWLSTAAPTGLRERLTAGAAAGRWTQDRVFVQMGAVGLVAVEVDLPARSSADREQVARSLAATALGEPDPVRWADPSAAPPPSA